MNYREVTINDRSYIECLPDGWVVDSENAALDLVAACGEVGTNRLLLPAESLPPAFYQLRTGLAGAILLKFSNYFIRCAAVLTPELVGQGRFQEMVLETNRGNQFRVYYDRESAERWLVSE